MRLHLLNFTPLPVSLGLVGLSAIVSAQGSAPSGSPFGASSQAGSSVAIDPVPIAGVTLADATLAAGLGGVYNDGNTHTGGAAWVDYNGDLLPDLFVTGGGGLPHYLFRNDGGGLFTDVTAIIPKIDLSLEESGVKFADLENDGDYDIFVGVDNPAPLVTNQPVNPSDGGPNLLYVNNGDGTFTESAAAYGVLNPDGRRTSCAGFADYDNDGFIDLYLGGWTMYELPLGMHLDYGHLLHNDGDGTFTDTTASIGCDNYGYDALVLLWFDMNFDRLPDLYIGNVAHTNTPPLFVPIDTFYLNTGASGFVDQVPGQPTLGDDAYGDMGLDVGDIDNDGDWDLYITDIVVDPPRPLGNVLYTTSDATNSVFTNNVADVAQVSADSSWPCNYVDFNHDGWVDLWVGGLHTTSETYVYLNDQTGVFERSDQPLLDGLAIRGGASADYDGDGDVDFVLTKYKQDMQLIRNDTANNGNWVEFKLYGTSTNRGAIGAVVKVTRGGVTQMRRVTGGDSAHSQSDSILHFGVGGAASVQVLVEWPSGTDQFFPEVATGGLVLIDEDAGILAPSVTDNGSSWSGTTQSLEVRLKSNFGGRIQLTLEGLGDLRYDAASLSHVGRFEGVSTQPGPLKVRSEKGDSFVVALEGVPRRP